MKVRDLMTPDPVVVKVPCDKREALRLMVRHGISGLPVVSKVDGSLVGIVTRKDIFQRPREIQLTLIMTPDPVTIGPEEDVRRASELFTERHIRRLPVVEDGNLIGIITPTDLLRVIEEEAEGTVEDYLSRICIPVYEETPLPVVMKIIHATQTYSLPILGKDGSLVGIVTDTDLFLRSRVDEDLVRSDLGMGDDEDTWTWEGMRYVMKLYYIVEKIDLPKIPVNEIMVRDVKTVYKETQISKAARIMYKHNIGQMPVIDMSNDLVGMLYSMDLMRWFLR